MNSSLRRLSLIGLLCIAGSSLSFAVISTPPYLETMPVTIIWQFNITGVGKNRVIQPVDSTGFVDVPADPVARVTTETGTPIAYSGGNGNQTFFVQQLLRTVLENYAESSRTLLLNNDAVGAQLYEDKIAYLKQHLNDQWELTAVRAPQTSADGVLTSPYWIFLTKIDSLQNRLLRAYDTGMRIVPKYSAGTKTETFTNSQLSAVTGTMTTYFTLQFHNLYTNDPLYLAPLEQRSALLDGMGYNSTGSEWNAYGSGYITYNLRKTSGVSGVVAPTAMRLTGTGSWAHTLFDNTAKTSKTYAGTAPLNIRMGEVKYQNSAFFPEFTP